MFDFEKLKAHYEEYRDTYEIDDILFILKHARIKQAYENDSQRVKHELIDMIGEDLAEKYKMTLDEADRMLFVIDDKPLDFTKVGTDIIDDPDKNKSKYYSLQQILKRHGIHKLSF